MSANISVRNGLADRDIPLNEIVVTQALRDRPNKTANYQGEAEALRNLARLLADEPAKILHALTNEIMKFTGADSCGVTLAEGTGADEIFRWHGISGELAKFVGGTMPRHFSPCGYVLDRDAAQVLDRPVRHYGYIDQLGIDLHEVLLVPLYAKGIVLGTIWIVSTRPDFKFTAEDKRIVESFAEFGAAAVSSYLTAVAIQNPQTSDLGRSLVSQKFDDMFENLVVGVALVRGPDLIFEKINPQFRALVGSRDYIGRRWVDVYPELPESKSPERMRHVLSSGEKYSVVENPITVNNDQGLPEQRHYNITYTQILNEEGAPYGVLIQAQDVSDQINLKKKSQAQLVQLSNTERRLRAAIEVAKVGFFDWDVVADKVTYSSQMQLDWELDEATPISGAFERIHEEDRQMVRIAINKSLETGNHYSAQYRLNLPSGKTTWIAAEGDVIRNEHGAPLSFLGSSVDITKHKMAEIETNEARQEAERANSAKSAFLANMSHEIRSPLGAIMGFAELLKGSELEPEHAEFVGVIDRNANHLLRVVDDILDLAKVEAGKMLIENINFSLPEMLMDFSSLMEMRARDKGIGFELHIPAKIPDSITSDPTRVRQILNNVVGNAIKFTDKGSVKFVIAFEGHQLQFSVIDTGPGISYEQQQQLFQPFHQADISTTRKYGGTGLGLVLTRRLCQALGGAFVLERSTVGEGSAFVATIKVGLPAHHQMIDSQSLGLVSQAEVVVYSPEYKDLQGLRVLVVEDSLDNQFLFNLILEKMGASVDMANDGLEGLNFAMEKEFDIILMDVQMPRMDGYEATRVLRDHGYNLPIVALTAHAMKEERERALKAGFSDFLSKPIDRDALIDVLRKTRIGQRPLLPDLT